MPRVSSVQQKVFEFTGGLNSDASPLNFPENATTDELNFLMNVNGSRRRRKGLALETSGVYATKTVASTDRSASFLWRSPGGSSDQPLVVSKVKNELFFYAADTAALSPNKLVYTYDLYDSAAPQSTNANIDQSPVQMDSVAGRLVVVGEYIEPTAIVYEFDAFTASKITLEMRDFEGEIDNLQVNDRPATLSDTHKYNLYNQGWNDSSITTYFGAKSIYPSNADIEYTGKIDNTTTNIQEFNSDQLEAQLFGSTPAPKGSAILQVFNTAVARVATDLAVTSIAVASFSGSTINTSAVHGLAVGDTITVHGSFLDTHPITGKPITGSYSYTTQVLTVPDADTITVVDAPDEDANLNSISFTTFNKPSGNEITARPSTVAAFAGRVWFAGIDYSRYTASLFFSSIIEEDEHLSQCFQKNDPTSEHLSDLLDSDGGRLILSDVGNVKKVQAYGNSLLVIADNGVWAVGPGEKGYFSPTSYRVDKIHDVGALSGTSVIKAEDSIFYFGTDGIYVVFFDPEVRSLVARNISLNKVNTRYEAIPNAVKKAAFGFYENTSQQVVWAYSNTDGTNTHRYINFLIYSKRFNAFITLKVADLSTFYVIGGVALTSQDSFTDNVKLLVYGSANTRVSWYDFNAIGFTDFASTEEEAYLVAGLTGGGDFHFPKTASYIHTYFNKTETGFSDDGSGNIVLDNPSGCTLQSRWDWANNTASGKFGPGQQVYRFTRNYIPSGAGDTFADGRPVIFTKNKLRGRGKSLQLKFTADTGKDCWLLGWSMLLDIAAGRT